MFSDLVGSTALSARMDPEDLREVISAYQKCVAETVQRFGGFVAKYMGDGVLVYFGYPQAHEDDAERAVRAGLELVAAVGGLKTHATLQTRVGIATGLVVVGDLIGSGASQEQAIVGETPNLAARLQGVAEPNRVVISEGTRKLVGSLFELEDLGAKDLKGVAESARAWAALRPATVESRFDALHASGLTELIGREEELEILLRRWSKAKTGEGQVVLLSGEPGIGKSRLMAALLERVAPEPHTRLRNFCSPQHTDSALYPTVGQIERAAGFRHDDGPLAKLDKLDALLAQSSTSPHDAALLAEMLSIPNDGRYPALELTSPERRQKTLETLVSQVTTLARQNPLLMIFEDAHWADPTSLELFGRIVGKIPKLRVLLIVTYRPEFDPPWIGRPHVTALTLNRLGEREIAAMIDRVIGNNALPESIRQDIIERTDGIPLFVEEMTKAVLEAQSEDAGERTVAAAPSPSVSVPASLHASLMARLDRLGAAKEVAQIGAAIGREFSHTLLAAVAGKPEEVLQSALNRLITAGLLFRQGVAPHASYLFKHALVQDAAYGTLLREPRRSLHARIAETLESRFVDTAERQPELLARHCTEAGQIEKAVGLWIKAGQRSFERSALVENVEQFKKALELIAVLPPTPALRRQRINVQAALITPLMHVKGHSAPETRAAAEEARRLIEEAKALGEAPEDALLLLSVLYGLWMANWAAFDRVTTMEVAGQFYGVAEKLGTSAALLAGHRVMGSTLMVAGEFPASRIHFDQAVALYDPVEHRSLAARFGLDLGTAVRCHRSLLQWVLGYPAAAVTDGEHAISHARKLGQAPSLMNSLFLTSLVLSHRGEFTAAKKYADEVVTLAYEKDAVAWKTIGAVGRGCALALMGHAADSIDVIGSGIAGFERTGVMCWLPMCFSHLALAHAELSRYEEAQRYIREAITHIEARHERWYEAELFRMAGEIALLSSELDAAKAEGYFQRALSVARQQQAKSWELRAATSLARLWRDQGKVQQARDLLVPVYGWFTKGFDTRDLKEAKALLDQLALAL
jgi:class 3 adenylate cyclase/predicted ATPase